MKRLQLRCGSDVATHSLPAALPPPTRQAHASARVCGCGTVWDGVQEEEVMYTELVAAERKDDYNE